MQAVDCDRTSLTEHRPVHGIPKGTPMRLVPRTTILATAMLAISALGIVSNSAQAYYTPTNSPSGNTKIGTIFQLPGNAGKAASWGSTSSCTGSYDNVDFGERYFSRVVVDGVNLDDKTSAFKDFASCDTRFFQYESYNPNGGEAYGFANGGSGGVDVPSAFDNRASAAWWS